MISISIKKISKRIFMINDGINQCDLDTKKKKKGKEKKREAASKCRTPK